MKLKSLSIFFLLSLLTSCSSIGYVVYDRLRPAAVSFPEEVHRVGILNAVPTGNEEVDEDGNLSGNGAKAVESLAQSLADTHYFDEVIVSDSILRNEEAVFSSGLSPLEQDYFMQSLGVDMLLVVNKISIRLKNDEIFYPEFTQPLPVVCGHVTPEILAYVPDRHQPLYNIQKTDSLYWDYLNDLYAVDVVEDASKFAGEIPVKLIVPYWEEAIRYIYNDGHINFRDAAVCAREGNWDDAAELWRAVYQKGKGKRKYMAAYNLAVYYEYLGQVDEVNKYLSEALSMVEKRSADEALMLRFKKDTEKELSKQQNLHVQMKRFDNKND